MSQVIVLGSLHYDVVVDAPVQPRKGETVAGRSWMPKCGGKGGNQAVAAARAGAQVAMVGAVGGDPFGQALIDNLDRAGVDHRRVRVEPNTTTGTSLAIHDGDGDYSAIIVSGANLTLCERDVASAGHLFGLGGWLVLQNEIPEAANVAAAATMKACGGHVLINAAPARLLSPSLTGFVDVLVANTVEAETLTGGAPIMNLGGALAAARQLSSTYAWAIVTAGGLGVAAAARDGNEITMGAIKVQVQSTHGAGDAFIGHLVASLARGEAMHEAISKANRAAARLVGGLDEGHAHGCST